MLKSIFTAVYTAIILEFIKRIFDKVKVSVEHEIPVKSVDDSGEHFVLVNGHYFVWEESREDALAWCFNAITRCRSLAGKLSVEESAEEHCLEAAEGIPGLSLDEIDSLNSTVDNMD